MARLPALIAALAKTDGRDAKAVAWFARVIREGGLMATTKRGLGAAEMTPRDAANLLIALNATTEPRDAIELVHIVRGFVPQRAGFSNEDGSLVVLGAISRAENFGEALEAAIANAPAIALMLLAHANERFDHPEQRSRALSMEMLGFSVEFVHCGAPISAALSLWQMVGHERRDEDVWKFGGDEALIRSGYYARTNADRRVIMQVGVKTLLHLFAATMPATAEETAEVMAFLTCLGLSAADAGE